MLVRVAQRDAVGRQGRRNLARAWVWQRNIGMALILEIVLAVDGWLVVNHPPATDLLCVAITVAGILGCWLTWRSCNRTLARMGLSGA